MSIEAWIFFSVLTSLLPLGIYGFFKSETWIEKHCVKPLSPASQPREYPWIGITITNPKAYHTFCLKCNFVICMFLGCTGIFLFLISFY